MPKDKKPFVDFRAIRERLTMEQVLEHYQVLHTFKRSGSRLSGPCPIHHGTNPTQFRVETDRNIWNCFSSCKTGGNALDFIAKKEDIIGCEISFTTTIDHEVGNVAKCLKAGCDHVAVICGDEARLAKIQQGVTASFAANEAGRVGYYLPEQFLARLPELVRQETAPPAPEPVRVGKYTVKRHGPPLTQAERLAREETALRIMAERMKRQR